ncbi:MAG: molybdate ABC transporter substrate-binding protein [Pseudomonadota bacterium]
MQLLPRAIGRALVAVVVAGTLLATPVAAAERVLVFAAASLKNALDEIAEGYTAETGDTVVVSFAGSSSLARQILQGAPADVFISANPLWMEAVAEDGLIDPASRLDLLGNTLVLVASEGTADTAPVTSRTDVLGLLDGGRLAMALVNAVPAGIYAKASLESLGLWQAVAPHVAQADNVRAALALVALGEAPLGIVYATDAAAEPDVVVVGTFAPSSHPPIVYQAAALAGSEAGARFVDHLVGEAAGAIFQRHGFTPLADAAGPD